MRTIKFAICISVDEYNRFKSHSATRLYLHTYSYSSEELTIWTTKPKDLCKDLAKVIDFGATTAHDLLGVDPYA